MIAALLGMLALSEALPLCSVAVAADAGEMIEMNFQGAVPLDALLGYLSGKLAVQYQYDGEIARREVTLRTPDQVPVDSLPVLLGNVLRSQGLVLADTEDPGIKRIVAASEMMPLATVHNRGDLGGQIQVSDAPRDWRSEAKMNGPMPVPRRLVRTDPGVEVDGGNRGQASSRPQDEEVLNPATPLTEVFPLRHVDAVAITEVLRPFASGTDANLKAVPGSNSLIVTDYASSIDSLRRVIELVDRPAPMASFAHYPCRYHNAAQLAEQANKMLRLGGGKGGSAANDSVLLLPQTLENRIAIAGSTAEVEDAYRLLSQLDSATDVRTEAYRVRHMAASRLATLLDAFTAPADRKTSSYHTTVDETGNQLIVRGGPSVHRQVAELIARMDVASPTEQSPIRFYKLKNAIAGEVLQSLLALAEVGGSEGGVDRLGRLGGLPLPTGVQSPLGNNAVSITPLPIAPATRADVPPGMFVDAVGGPIPVPGMIGELPGGFDRGSMTPSPFSGSSVGLGGIGGAAAVAKLPGGARVSADASTNSLIVYAPSDVQAMYAQLIRSLDQRRPQVLIQAQVIAVSTTDNYSLGIEVSGGDRLGSRRMFNFTSFGLNEVDPLTGALNLNPGLGFNGAVLDPGIADVILQALAQHDRSRVLASPKILVNDNSTGTLESVVSVPFASVNASQTVSTTSLGGSQQAGTIITVTPRINENDHLQLDFDVEFSTFSGTGSATLPPLRQIDRVGSSVTIPSGKTVIVGGLRRVSDSSNETGFPIIEKIPLLRHLAGRSSDLHQTTSFFLFIRPVVLRDSQFADLKFLSDRQLGAACLPGELPVSQPEAIEQ